MDWVAWHADYDRPGSSLARRLTLVQSEIRAAVGTLPAGRITPLSVCAGEGRDLIGAFADHPRAGDLHARLVELDPTLADRARSAAAAAGLDDVDVVSGDASLLDVWDGFTPADLVLAVGVLGNVSDDDVRHIAKTLPRL